MKGRKEVVVKKKNFISLLVAAAMVLSLTACGGGAAAPTGSDSQEKTTEEVSEGAVEDAGEDAADITAEAVSAAAAEAETASTAPAEAATEEAAETAATAMTNAAETAEALTMIKNGDMVLPVPDEYLELLNIETPENDEEGILFKVYEKASVEAAAANGITEEGPGWLFDIGVISEEALKEALCEDMSGRTAFARAEDGSCYVFYHPTDVRLERASNEEMDEAMPQWGALNEWGAAVQDEFVRCNGGLISEKHSNTSLDMYLARIAYKNDVEYTLSTLEYGHLKPGDVDPLPYAGQLINGVTFEYAEDEETPDGEYVVLTIPEDNVRYDFFYLEGKQNYVEEVRTFEGEGEDEEYKTLYRGVFADEQTSATVNEIMDAWYGALEEQMIPADDAGESGTAEAVE